jgi:lysophospholipase L1-like esterase
MNISSTQLRLFILAGAFLLFASGLGHAQQTGPTPLPDVKDEAAWPGKGPLRTFPYMMQNRISFWARRDLDQGKIVFVGDSIIGGWKLENDFPGKPVANRGIGGDVTRGVLFRFQEDVLDLHPKAVVIEIGSNDLSADAPIEGIVSNYNAILDLAQKANPDMPVIILAILPRGISTGDKAPSAQMAEYLKKVNARIPQLNAELAQIPASRKNVTYVDAYNLFLLPDGSQDESQFIADKVHPTAAGHAKLGAAVTKALTDLKLL